MTLYIFDTDHLSLYGRNNSVDLRIASIVLAHQAILLSRNARDFDKVPDLIIENWTV